MLCFVCTRGSDKNRLLTGSMLHVCYLAVRIGLSTVSSCEYQFGSILLLIDVSNVCGVV